MGNRGGAVNYSAASGQEFRPAGEESGVIVIAVIRGAVSLGARPDEDPQRLRLSGKRPACGRYQNERPEYPHGLFPASVNAYRVSPAPTIRYCFPSSIQEDGPLLTGCVSR